MEWLIPALISAFVGLVGAGFSYKSQKETNEENLDYAASTTQAQWERDDTRYQTSVKDAVAAGFSPLAVLDGGVTSTSNALGYQAQAPQFDVSNLVNSLSSISQNMYDSSESSKRHEEKLEELAYEFDNHISELELSLQNELTAQQRDYLNTVKILNLQLENSKTLESTKAALEVQSAIKENLVSLGVTEFESFVDWDSYIDALYDYAQYIDDGLFDYSQHLFQFDESSSGSVDGKVVVVSGSASSSESHSLSVDVYLKSLFMARPFPEYVGEVTNKKPLSASQKAKLKSLYIDVNKTIEKDDWDTQTGGNYPQTFPSAW